MNRQGSAPPFSGGYAGGSSRWDALKDDSRQPYSDNRGGYNTSFDGGRGGANGAGGYQNYNRRDMGRGGGQARDSGLQINNRWDNRTEYNSPEGGYPEATKDNWTVPLPRNDRLEKYIEIH